MINHLIGFHPSFSALILRIALGAVFIAHGRTKLFKKDWGPLGIANFFQSIRLPAPLIFAYVVGIVEFFGGIFLIAGLLTRLAAVAIAFDMLVAIVKVRFDMKLGTRGMMRGIVGGYELELSLLAMAVVLVILGAGKFSIDFQVFHQW